MACRHCWRAFPNPWQVDAHWGNHHRYPLLYLSGYLLVYLQSQVYVSQDNIKLSRHIVHHLFSSFEFQLAYPPLYFYFVELVCMIKFLTNTGNLKVYNSFSFHSCFPDDRHRLASGCIRESWRMCRDHTLFVVITPGPVQLPGC